MTAAVHRRALLKSRPAGEPSEDNFAMVEAPIPEPGAGQFLARTLDLSLDPYRRGRVSDRPSSAPSAELGEPMVGGTVGQAVRSNHRGHAEGDHFVSDWGWQEHGVSDGSGMRTRDLATGPISYALGMPSFTADTGLLNLGQPKSGETLVAAASGAVGPVFGQAGKVKGSRVVGITGGQRPCRYVEEEPGIDACLDHHPTRPGRA